MILEIVQWLNFLQMYALMTPPFTVRCGTGTIRVSCSPFRLCSLRHPGNPFQIPSTTLTN
jgi:hypothetical protein